MNLYQCQERAKEIGFNEARFFAEFPAGPVECQWMDAYMGFLKIDADGLRDGFVTTKKIDERFPNLTCSELWIEDEAAYED